MRARKISHLRAPIFDILCARIPFVEKDRCRVVVQFWPNAKFAEGKWSDHVTRLTMFSMNSDLPSISRSNLARNLWREHFELLVIFRIVAFSFAITRSEQGTLCA